VVEPIAGEIGARRIRLSGGRDLLRWRDGPGAKLEERLLDGLPGADDLSILQYTGGTTGRAKGVNLTHRAVSTNVAQREALLPTRAEAERVLAVTPLFHSYAMTMGLYLAASCRGTLILLPRYRPELVLSTVAAERVTRFCGSPTLFTGLMAHQDFGPTDFSSLALCYSGAAALPAETLRRWESATHCGICEGYGQTEAGPVLTFNPEEGPRKIGSVGIAVPGTEIQIVDVETRTHVLGTGEKGEIRARGPQLMSGYRNLPGETAQALRDGWLYTGDVGELDAEGYLFIRDRKKDMVIVSGFNVYPREVEEALAQHPDVSEAAVVGVAHAHRGEALRAFVVPRSGCALTAEALASHLGERLVKYKLPDDITLVPFLPKTSIGKIDKVLLRKSEVGQG
jgi:long-chain acyl-CoA synthetase